MSGGTVDVKDAGRRGGKACAKKHGRAHYEKAGKLGGAALAERGSDHFASIGAKGGRAILKKRGRAYYSEIGKRGGAKVKEAFAQMRARAAAK